jgi:hypothetical protein
MKKNANVVIAIPAPEAENVPSRRAEISKSRDTALAHTSAENIQHLDVKELMTVQTLLEHGNQYGFWKTPEKWALTEDGTATVNVNLRQRITHFLAPGHRALLKESNQASRNDDAAHHETDEVSSDVALLRALVEGAVLSITRYLILLRMGPAGFVGRNKGSSLDPTTVRGLAYDALPRLYAACVSRMFDDHSSLNDAPNWPDASAPLSFMGYIPPKYVYGLSASNKKTTINELGRMLVLGSKGYWNDIPVLPGQLAGVTEVAGDELPRQGEGKKDPHLPLPDDYVSEMGAKSLWLIESLAPNLFPILKKFQAIWSETIGRSLSENQLDRRRRSSVREYLEAFVWSDSTGEPIRVPPFALNIVRRGIASESAADEDEMLESGLWEESDEPLEGMTWPPRTPYEIFALAHAVQLAHMFVVALAMAARRSEIVTLERSCIQYAPDGLPYASGRTFKLVERHEGATRDWVLPDVSAAAIEQQVRLIGLLETIGGMTSDRSSTMIGATSQPPGRHLWAQSGHGGSDRAKRLINLTPALRQYAKTLGMDQDPGGQSIRPHRLRKTIARLVALALAQAPKILMDVFGHKSIEMTLYYILTDKDLRAEIERVTRELRIVRATEAVEKTVANEDATSGAKRNGGYGGPAALALHRAIKSQKDGLHRLGKEWGAENAMELAEILTLQGKAWQYVRPGVICTKFPGTESGPCNKSKGHPEPARCQTHCRHRLEEEFLREDVDGAIRDSVKAYVAAGETGEDLVQALWAGQIRAHLIRFEDIRLKWLNDPVVQRVLAEEEAEGAVA